MASLKKCLFFLLFFFVQEISAQTTGWQPGYWITGNDYLDLNSTQKNYYIVGIAEGAQFLQEADNRRSFCIPIGVSINQITAIATNYLLQHPEKWQETASGNILFAILIAFPCRK